MRVDPATLRDLEILDAGEGATPLAALVDHTLTARGRDRLRGRLRQPLRTLDEIRGTQDAVRHLLARVDAVRTVLGRLGAGDVEAYLGLRWEPARARTRAGLSLEGAILRVRYSDALREILRGVALARTLVDGVAPLLEALGDRPPTVLRLAIENIRAARDDRAIAEVQRASRALSRAEALRLDRLLRGDGRPALRTVLAGLAELDALQSLAFAVRRNGWTIPEFLDDAEPRLTLLGLRHPLMTDGIPNDVHWPSGVRVAAITGPNMAGKTTLLKATALAVYLAHCGTGVPARVARLTPADACFSSLYVRDNLAGGESFYLAEVRRVRQLAALLSEYRNVFAVIDEPFKGTNIRDASDASDLLLAALARHPGCRVLLATHLADVVRHRLGVAGLEALRLEGQLTQHGLRFDFALRAGISEQRLGMELLRREGVVHLLENRFEAPPVPQGPLAPGAQGPATG
ncbi:MAG TPA: hypothetical protein VLE53_13275 [Gemmatimonadaceae bacterium]|nr:hypothetical protein [Gemmatimonadaceae bacterium]